MMEKQNSILEKAAAGDALAIDDIVDGAATRFARKETPGARGRGRVSADKDEPLCR